MRSVEDFAWRHPRPCQMLPCLPPASLSAGPLYPRPHGAPLHLYHISGTGSWADDSRDSSKAKGILLLSRPYGNSSEDCPDSIGSPVAFPQRLIASVRVLESRLRHRPASVQSDKSVITRHTQHNGNIKRSW